MLEKEKCYLGKNVEESRGKKRIIECLRKNANMGGGSWRFERRLLRLAAEGEAEDIGID